MAKKTAKGAKPKKATKAGAGAGRAAVSLQLTASQKKKAQECLERSGKIELGFKTISVTKLPKSIAPVAVFMD